MDTDRISEKSPDLKFGDFLRQKRTEKGVSLRNLATKLSISAVYLCDIENNRRNAFSKEAIDVAAEVLELSKEEVLLAYDLAGETKNMIPLDLPSYIIGNEVVKTALRTAREQNIPDEEWKDFIGRISKSE